MGLHKLTAGDGYTYLTRQVAAGDSTERGYTSLGDYYAAKGESPGVWLGAGADVLGLTGRYVTEQQMKNLFGQGIHPDAERIVQEKYALGWSVPAARRATLLGARFPVFEGDSEWRGRLTERYAAWNTVRGLPGDWPVPAAERARIRTDTAREMFTQAHGRAPGSTQELDGFLRRTSRPTSSAIAGYDLTFTPVKSVSTLWAIAPIEMSEAIEEAHQAAVAATLQWLGRQVAYTRTGARGVAQVNTDGLICAAFTHRDSRAGDPDLHTHVAVSNKVRVAGSTDRWLALDGRMIHRYAVAGSEMYNTLLEAEVTARIGARFAERPSEAAGRRPVRELIGVNPELAARWSTRREAITAHREQLVADFRAAHGRLPTAVEMVALSEQSTLATRQAKHEPRSLAEQRATWRGQAEAVLGGPRGVQRTLADVTAGRDPDSPTPTQSRSSGLLGPVSRGEVAGLAAATVAAVAGSRALWSAHNLAAEAARQVRGRPGLSPEQVVEWVGRVAGLAAGPEHCVPVGFDADVQVSVATPGPLTRADGTSVYRMAGGQRYTSPAILDAERRIVAAAGAGGARNISLGEVELAGLEWSANNGGAMLNTSQAALVAQVATSDRKVMLALAPAGSGKTTAMGVLTRAWQSAGGTVVGLAPQASAAHVLGKVIGASGDTLDKLVYDIGAERGRAGWDRQIRDDTLVIVDEAGLASTGNLDAAIGYVTGRGGRVLLVGDDRQRAAAGAGGVLRDIEAVHGAVSLTEVLRFTDPVEAQVSLALRAGDPAAAAFYTDRGRLHPVAADEAADHAYTAWARDIAAGADSIMIAPTLEQVAELNARARADRLAATGRPAGPELRLPSGETLSAGDLIVTKRNARGLSLGGTDFVRNNDRWIVGEVHRDGSITATHHDRGVTRRLPAWYINAGHVRLGYATTAASVQGLTVGRSGVRRGTAHAIIADGMTRNEVYPVLTRATDGTHAYVISTRRGDPHDVVRPESLRPATAAEALARIIATDGSAVSATTAARRAHDPVGRLAPAAAAYTHAVGTGAAALLGPKRMAQIADDADAAVPGVTAAPAWDTLHLHLARLAVDGLDPIEMLAAAAARRELGTARDVAAVLDWRTDPNGEHSHGGGPLSWLPAIPRRLSRTPEWSAYLAARARLVTDLTAQLSADAARWDPSTAPGWATPYLDQPTVLRDLAVWRAAHAVPETDLRPAGPLPGPIAEQHIHNALSRRATTAAGNPHDGASRWFTTLSALGADHVTADDYWPVLAGRLTLAGNAGLPVGALLEGAVRGRPLPAEQPAAALWWRLAPHLGDLTATGSGRHHQRPPWTHSITGVIGTDLADAITADRLWPTIVTTIDAAARRGIDPTVMAADAAALLSAHTAALPRHQAAAALLATITTLTDPAPPDPAEVPLDPIDEETSAPDDARTAHHPPARDTVPAQTPPPLLDDDEPPAPELFPPDTAQAEQNAALVEWEAADHVAAIERSLAAQAAAHDFYTAHAPRSWVPGYLTGRGLPADAAGYAPAGWDHLVRHLHAAEFSDNEIKAAGLAKTSTRGTLIDVFRDRAVLPIHDDHGRIVAFIGRANPAAPASEDYQPPKYLNSPGTDLFAKSELPYGLNSDAISALKAGADLAITEGPMDALAVTEAARTALRNLVAVAPNGTALTPGQLHTLNRIGPLADRVVILALDNDPAGLAAAARAYPLLVAAGVTEPLTVTDWSGKDPAELLANRGPAGLAAALDHTRPLADLVVDAALSRWPIGDGTVEARSNALNEAATLVAAMPAAQGARQAERLTQALDLDPFTVTAAIDRRRVDRELDLPAPPVLSPGSIAAITEIAAQNRGLTDLAGRIHPDLTADPGWPSLAEHLHRAADLGYDITTRLPRLADGRSLDSRNPARDLEFRLIADCPDCYQPVPDQPAAEPGSAAVHPAAHAPRPGPAPAVPRPGPVPRR